MKKKTGTLLYSTALILAVSFASAIPWAVFAGDIADQRAGEGPSSSASSAAEQAVRQPENPLADSVLESELMEKGTPYDAAGLLTYRIAGGSAEIMSCDPAVTGDIYLPEFIEDVPVTAIHDYAFLYCANLTSVTIPDTVTEIGDYAFCYCTKLASVTMKSSGISVGEHAFYRCYDLSDLQYGVINSVGDYAFAYCTGLRISEFHEGLDHIGSYAFSGCSGLTSVTLPESLTKIDDFAFNTCENLTYVYFPSGLSDEGTGAYILNDCDSLNSIKPSDIWKNVPEGIFARCDGITDFSGVLHEGTEKIGGAAFFRCTGMTEVEIPSTVTEIGYGAFQQTALTAVVLPEGLTVLGGNAFAMTDLSEINLPESLEEIGAGAFSTTKISGELRFGNRVKTVGSRAFNGSQITSVVINGEIDTVGDMAFANTPLTSVIIEKGGDTDGWGNSVFLACSRLKSFTIPSSWTKIPQGLLASCSSLCEIALPDSISEIEEKAFYKCSSLTELKLPSGLLSIGASAFEGAGVKHMTIPPSVKSLSESLFQDAKLEQITLSDGLESIGTKAFFGSAVVSVDIPDTVTKLGEDVFRECRSLRSVSVGKGLETIPDRTFCECTALETVRLSKGLKCIGLDSAGEGVFTNCSSLKNITLPEGLEIIGWAAFKNCTALETVNFPSTLRALEYSAFRDCSGLSTLKLAEGLSPGAWYRDYGSVWLPFEGCSSLVNVNIPSNWTEIPQHFLNGAKGPKNVALNSRITKIGAYAFHNCTGVESITIPSSVTEIGDYAFYGCSLKSVTIPDSVIKFGDFAVGGCPNLSEIRIPSSWKEVPSGLLKNNTVLKTFVIPDGIESIGESAFEGSAIETVEIPDSVTSIGESAFQDCKNLRYITLPENLTVLGISAFQGSGIEEITVPGSLEKLQPKTFMDCDSLKTVVIEDGVTAIDGFALGYCDLLAEVTIPNSVVNIAAFAFFASNPGNVHLSVSQNSQGAKAAEAILYVYSDWSNRLEGASYPYFGACGQTAGGVTYYRVTYQGITYQIDIPISWHADEYYYSYDYDFSASVYHLESTYDESVCTVSDYVADSSVPVTAIGDNVFESCKSIRTVILGQFIEEIGKSAFADCTNLTLLDMSGSSVSTIRDSAFSGCGSLNDIRWSSDLKKIEDSAFAGCTSLKSVDFSAASLTTLGKSVFLGDSAITSVKFAESLDWVDDNAFSGTSVTSVEIPQSTSIFQPTAFEKGVVLNFTGDATKVQYYFMNNMGMIEYAPVLPVLLENNNTRIEQFFGEGLTQQGNYFISTEKAGLNVPYGLQSASAVFGIEGPPAGGQLTDGEAQTTASDSLETADPQVSITSDISDAEDAEEPEAEEEISKAEDDIVKMYEVVTDIFKENPFITAALVLLLAALIVSGGVRRYRKTR